jgi:hypothetical protein
MIPPGNPFAGRGILDLEAVRVQLERDREALDRHPSRTDTWAKAVQRVEAQLVQVREEISLAGTSVIQDA